MALNVATLPLILCRQVKTIKHGSVRINIVHFPIPCQGFTRILGLGGKLPRIIVQHACVSMRRLGGSVGMPHQKILVLLIVSGANLDICRGQIYRGLKY